MASVTTSGRLIAVTHYDGKKVVIIGAGRPASQLLMSWRSHPSRPQLSRRTPSSAGSRELSITRAITSTSVVTASSPKSTPSTDVAGSSEGRQFLHRNRLSRIYYNKQFFHYPLRAANALFGLGVWNSFLIL